MSSPPRRRVVSPPVIMQPTEMEIMRWLWSSKNHHHMHPRPYCSANFIILASSASQCQIDPRLVSSPFISAPFLFVSDGIGPCLVFRTRVINSSPHHNHFLLIGFVDIPGAPSIKLGRRGSYQVGHLFIKSPSLSSTPISNFVSDFNFNWNRTRVRLRLYVSNPDWK